MRRKPSLEADSRLSSLAVEGILRKYEDGARAGTYGDDLSVRAVGIILFVRAINLSIMGTKDGAQIKWNGRVFG